MLKPDDCDIGLVSWMRETLPYLRAEIWASYVAVGVDVVPRWGNRIRGVLIRYRRCGGDGRIDELYSKIFRHIARLKLVASEAGRELEA